MSSTWTRLLAALTVLALLGVPTASFSQNSPFPLQQTAVLQAAAAATGNGTFFATGQMGVVTLQVTGTLTSLTVSFEATNDGSNFVALTCYTLDSNTSATSTTTTGVWRCNTSGLAGIRARVSTYSSGTVTVTANGTSNAGNVRDTITQSGAITGQLRGSQTTAPTMGVTTGALGTVVGTDSFMTGLIGNPPNWSGSVVVTFNAAYAAKPACVASWDGTAAYGYYVSAVSSTTTAATIKLGGVHGLLTNAGWSPGDTFNLLCAGTQ